MIIAKCPKCGETNNLRLTLISGIRCELCEKNFDVESVEFVEKEVWEITEDNQ